MLAIRPMMIAVSGLLLVTACGTMPGNEAVFRGDNTQVSIAPAGQAGGNLKHPASIEPGQLHRILSSLEYEEQGRLSRSARTSVFDAEELDELTPQLASALADAAANQRVEFVSLGHGGLVGSGSRKTEGTLFIGSDGQLNIAFSGIQHLMTVHDDFTRFRETSLGDPLGMTRSLKRLATDPDFLDAKRQSGGDRYPMWVIARIDAAPTTRRVEPAPATPPPTPTAPQTRRDDTRATDPGPVEPDTGSLAPEEIRQRLAFIKSLHEDGLISDEDYERERQLILRRLD